jgi:hypothetical protein
MGALGFFLTQELSLISLSLLLQSGPLESLPETHSLALDAAVRPNPASITGAAAAAAAGTRRMVHDDDP